MSAVTWKSLDAHTLRNWPLPALDSEADKEERGRVLVVAGSRELAGAAPLAGVAALRAGAGKLVIATALSVAPHIAIAVPEARVIGLPENVQGSFREDGVKSLEPIAQHVAAVLVGPGMMDSRGNMPFVAALLSLFTHVPLVLDAGAMDVVIERKTFRQPVLLTPHAGEMAHLMGVDKKQVDDDPEHTVLAAARQWNAVVALKGAVTLVATSTGEAWRHEAFDPGLATSGSGDVLAGLIAGFAARRAPLEQACAWGVVLHALAGNTLSRELGPLGYLARELAATVPPLLRRLSPARRPKAG
jgi:ADP-dependent NAD(P)H-hydrate dehydratase